MQRLELANRLEELDRLHGFLLELAREGVLPESEIDPVNLVLEELVTNSIQYGLEAGTDHTIEIGLECDDGRIEIEVRDDGRPFDLRDVPAPDLASPLDQRPVGGLGVHLVRSLTDTLEYERVGGYNVVRAVRRVA